MRRRVRWRTPHAHRGHHRWQDLHVRSVRARGRGPGRREAGRQGPLPEHQQEGHRSRRRRAGRRGRRREGHPVRRHGDGCPGVRRDEQHGRGRDAPGARLRSTRGAARVSRARASSDEPSEDPLLLVGGNCSLQGLDASGEEAFWTVASDVVAALGVFADGKIAVGTEGRRRARASARSPPTGRSAVDVRGQRGGRRRRTSCRRRRKHQNDIRSRPIFAKTKPIRISSRRARDGAVGRATPRRALARRARASKRATCAVAFDLTGDGSNEMRLRVRGRHDGGAAFPNRGESCSKLFDAPLAAVVVREGETRPAGAKTADASSGEPSGDLVAGVRGGRRGARVPRQAQRRGRGRAGGRVRGRERRRGERRRHRLRHRIEGARTDSTAPTSKKRRRRSAVETEKKKKPGLSLGRCSV